MKTARLAAVLTLGAAIGWARPAAAETRRVALADAADDDTVIVRMRAELAAAGFVVVEVPAWSLDSSPSTVAARLTSTGAVAALRVEDGGAEVWLIDPRRRTVSLREVVRALPEQEQQDPTLAIRTVEVVRAELSGARARTRRRSALAGITSGTGQDPGPAADRGPFSFALGLGLSAAPGGVPIAPAFVAGARWMPNEYIGAAAVVVASPFHSTVEASEGATSVWTGLAGAGLAVEANPRSAWGFVIESGATAGWLHLDGDAAPGFRSQTDTLVVAGPYLRPSLRWRLTPAFALHLDLLGAIVFPRPVISFAGREAATWGRPVIASAFGVEVSP